MALGYADQQDLLLPIMEGLHETPPWGVFLRNLVARTHARRGLLVLRLAGAPADEAPMLIPVAAPRAVGEPPLSLAALDRLGLQPLASLRPGRVYALDEMLDFGSRGGPGLQREALAAMGIRDGRWLRVSAGGAADAWLVLVRERAAFASSVAATLSAVAPHFAAALRAMAALAAERLRGAMAQAALGRLGIGQLAFDEEGGVLAADSLAERLLPLSPAPEARAGLRLNLLPAAAAALERDCRMFAASPSAPSRTLPLDPAGGLTLLLAGCELALPEPTARPAAIGTLRLARREEERAAARVLREIHQLSEREAMMAAKMSRGQGIVEAGRALRLTDETARNYSKRIYERTGARGQADLVRLILSGLAPLA